MALAVPRSASKHKKNQYQAIQSEEEQSLIPSNNASPAAGQNDSGNRRRSSKKKHRRRSSSKHSKEERKSSQSLWVLLTNTRFVFFVVNCLVPFAIAVWSYMLWPDISLPFILSGIIGLTVTVQAFRSFKQLMEITAGVNAFAANNERFKAVHTNVRAEVNRVKSANHELKQTEKRLRSSMDTNRENLTQFRKVQGYMKQLDVKNFKPLVDKSESIARQWREQLLAEERRMLHLIFDRFEMAHDGKAGMNKEEFTAWLTFVPEAYQKRFARLGTFETLSSNKGILDYADFEAVLDVFAQMVVDNVDIEVELVYEPSALPSNPSLMSVSGSQLASMSAYSDVSEDEDHDDDKGVASNIMAKLMKWKSTRRTRDSSVNVKVRYKSAFATPTVESPNVGDYEDMFGAIDLDLLVDESASGGSLQNRLRVNPHASRPLLHLSENPENIEEQISVSTINNMNITDVEETSFTDMEMDNFMKKTMQKNVVQSSALTAVPDDDEEQ